MTTRLESLSPREQDVYALVARGLPNKVIAHRFGIREQTVKHYLTKIMQKLGVANRVEVALTFHGIDFREQATNAVT